MWDQGIFVQYFLNWILRRRGIPLTFDHINTNIFFEKNSVLQTCDHVNPIFLHKNNDVSTESIRTLQTNN